MAAGSLARRYARAIYSLGTDGTTGGTAPMLDALGRDLRGLAATMKVSPELITALTNPALRRADRKRVLEALLTRLAVNPTTRNIVFLLLDRDRLGSLPDIAREVDAMIETKAGRVSAEVTSAEPLTATQVIQLTAQLEKLSGKKVELVRREDPTLLGGVVARLGDVVYDGSLRSQLDTLRDSLAK